MNVVLVGFMGSGKSKVGRLLAERTGRTHLDTDDMLMQKGKTVADLFATEGETEMRKRRYAKRHSRRTRSSRRAAAPSSTSATSVH
jgi:shikimate kinase